MFTSSIVGFFVFFLFMTFSGADYFTLAFKFGDFVPFITVLRFQCRPNATWSGSTDGKVPFHPSVSLSKDKVSKEG